jgi:hypothetical protein
MIGDEKLDSSSTGFLVGDSGSSNEVGFQSKLSFFLALSRVRPLYLSAQPSGCRRFPSPERITRELTI